MPAAACVGCMLQQIKLLIPLVTSVIQGNNVAEAVQQCLRSKLKRQRAA